MESLCDNLQEEGFIFKPSLQDISLKRFRMRYSVTNDCYYLHWDNAVCPQLAHIEGLERGVYSVSRLKRCHDDSKDMSFLSCENGASSGEIQWKIDFSNCGLVINRLRIQGRWEGEGNGSVVWTLKGDDNITYELYLGERVIELDELAGCKSMTLTASVTMETDTDFVRLLTGNSIDCPLDISGDLMCTRREDVPYIGGILLGLKFSPEEGEEDTVEEGEGQLQVHIVEGAGIVDAESHKPFNASVKCDLLPDPRRYSVKQTSPKHNAYPTWAKEFVFTGLKRSDVIVGGLEVILYDHHRLLHDAIVGGIRLSVPLKNEVLQKCWSSPVRSRSNSPANVSINGYGDGQASPNNLSQTMPSPFSKSKSLPGYYHDQATLSPLPQRRAHSPSPPPPNNLSPMLRRGGAFRRRGRSPSPSPRGSPLNSPNTLSPIVPRRDTSPSPSPKGSSTRNLFRLSGSHLRELSLSSPVNSPILSRKNRRSPLWRKSISMDSEFLYWWMDSSGDEVNHWQQVIDNDGEWIYCWHALRPKLKPAYST